MDFRTSVLSIDFLLVVTGSIRWFDLAPSVASVCQTTALEAALLSQSRTEIERVGEE